MTTLEIGDRVTQHVKGWKAETIMRGEPVFGCPKDRPQMAARDAQHDEWERIDRAESKKVKKRSKGICEVLERGVRCKRRAFEVHHHKGGWKLRGRGDSALAIHKTHACSDCHRLITGNILIRVSGNKYRRDK